MPYGDDDIENELKVRKLLEEHTDWSFEFTKNDRYAVDMQLFDWGEPPVDADARSLVGYVEIEVANEESDWDTGEFPWPRVNFLKRKIRLWDWDKNNWGDLKANARKTIYLKFNNQLDNCFAACVERVHQDHQSEWTLGHDSPPHRTQDVLQMHPEADALQWGIHDCIGFVETYYSELETEQHSLASFGRSGTAVTDGGDP